MSYYSLRKFCCFIQLDLSGDVELNPGSNSRVKNNASKCIICNKAVGTNSNREKCQVRITNVIMCKSMGATLYSKTVLEEKTAV